MRQKRLRKFIWKITEWVRGRQTWEREGGEGGEEGEEGEGGEEWIAVNLHLNICLKMLPILFYKIWFWFW